MNGCVSPFGRRKGQRLPAEVQDPSQVCRTSGTRILKSSQSKESGHADVLSVIPVLISGVNGHERTEADYDQGQDEPLESREGNHPRQLRTAQGRIPAGFLLHRDSWPPSWARGSPRGSSTGS